MELPPGTKKDNRSQSRAVLETATNVDADLSDLSLEVVPAPYKPCPAADPLLWMYQRPRIELLGQLCYIQTVMFNGARPGVSDASWTVQSNSIAE